MKKGKAAQKVIAKEDAVQEARSKNKIFRFWLPKDADARITFLDGDLDEDGILDIPMFYEHQLHMNGNWFNWFACTQDNEPCPICEGGDTPSLVGVMSVIDHSEFKKKDGTVVKHSLKLFAAKRNTIKQLQKIATKRKGLAGATFEVSRIGDQAASVGDTFDFEDKMKATIIKKKYGKDMIAYDYDKVINYLEAKDLRKLGFGSMAAGAEDGVTSGDEPDYDEDL